MSFIHDYFEFLLQMAHPLTAPPNFMVSLSLGAMSTSAMSMQSRNMQGWSWKDRSVMQRSHASFGAILITVLIRSFHPHCDFADVFLSNMPFNMNYLGILYQYKVY